MFFNPRKLETRLIWLLVLSFTLFSAAKRLFAEESKEKAVTAAVEKAEEEQRTSLISKPKPIKMPLVVSGEVIEYVTEAKEIKVTGNVQVDYKGSRLTCDRLVVNTDTKIGWAQGHARVEDARGIIEGEKLTYNFQEKYGTAVSAEFRAYPYFGKGERIEKVGDVEIVALNGYATTCSMDRPHYRIRSGQVNVIPGDRIQTKDDIVYFGSVPFVYLPQYSHSLKEPIMHVQMDAGQSKDWGQYLLTAWRFRLTPGISGRIYLDYRTKKGVAEGLGANYDYPVGKGDLKFYYMQERDHSLIKGDSRPRIFQRYFIRWRHKWTIDPRTNLTAELFKITDSKRFVPTPTNTYNILKDYFPREYGIDSKPLTYMTLSHAFSYAGIDAVLQKRINNWYSQLEKLPEVKFSLPSIPLWKTPFYIDQTAQAGNFEYIYAVQDSSQDKKMVRFDATQKISLPFRVMILNLNPFVMNRETFYNKDAYDNSNVYRNIFYAGSDISTNLYRIFDIKTNFLGLDINRLRHIVNPTIQYSYNHRPTVPSDKLKHLDSYTDEIDNISADQTAKFQLSNILETKRGKSTVKLVDFRVTSNYNFKTKSRKKSSFSDYVLDLEVYPYSWLWMESQANYDHRNGYFTNVRYDVNFDFGKERTLALGQTYGRKSSNEFRYNLIWRLTPKWKFSVYQRMVAGHRDPSIARGLREQEYSLTRDLHCWEMDFRYNVTEGKGESVWLIFRLKAFPELEFNYDQTYHVPKPGSQSGQ